jgi:hypothetical protein
MPAAVRAAPPAALTPIRPHSVLLPVACWLETATGPEPLPPPVPLLIACAPAAGTAGPMIAPALAAAASMETPRLRRI